MHSEPLLKHPIQAPSAFFDIEGGCLGFRRFSRSTRRTLALIDTLEHVTPFQKIALMNRYISIQEPFHRRVVFYSYSFHIGHFVVTVGSLIVPALLSIQYTNTGQTGPNNLEYMIYWATWITSLLVTISNGVLTLFKIDKKYYLLHTALSQIESEMSSYFTLTGKYGGHYTKGRVPTHENQYVYICHHLEKIKMKQVEEEYYKIQESKNEKAHEEAMILQTTNAPPRSTVAGMFQPTPSKEVLEELQQQQAVQINQIHRQKSLTFLGGDQDGSKEPSKSQEKEDTVQITIPNEENTMET